MIQTAYGKAYGLGISLLNRIALLLHPARFKKSLIPSIVTKRACFLNYHKESQLALKRSSRTKSRFSKDRHRGLETRSTSECATVSSIMTLRHLAGEASFFLKDLPKNSGSLCIGRLGHSVMDLLQGHEGYP
jgi:hypothetical protein